MMYGRCFFPPNCVCKYLDFSTNYLENPVLFTQTLFPLFDLFPISVVFYSTYQGQLI